MTERGEGESAAAEYVAQILHEEAVPRDWLATKDLAGGEADVREPQIFTTRATYVSASGLGDEMLATLHNAYGDAPRYPLSVARGTFFTEVLGARNPDAAEYYELMAASMEVLRVACGPDGVLPFADLVEVGRQIARLDNALAAIRIGVPPDRLHRSYGLDAGHPYSKLTLCRTTVPVRLAVDKVVPFFFEKFLVAYSYRDASGRRRCTITPLHTHPINFETAYFVSSGARSRVVEQEFELRGPRGLPLVRPDGSLDPEFANLRPEDIRQVTLAPGASHEIRPSRVPQLLATFDSDAALMTHPELLHLTDGLFRPHQVSVLDDAESPVETMYYALDNYFGPCGRVLIYSPDGTCSLWNHDNWQEG